MSGVTRSEFYQVEHVFDDAGRLVAEKYRNSAGRLQSPGNLPAVVEFNLVTGFPQHLHWYTDGVLDRNTKPASMSFDASAGRTVYKGYYEDGVLDPYRHPPCLGAVIAEKVYERGLLHSSVGNLTLILRSPEGYDLRGERHVHGVLHHDFLAAVYEFPAGHDGPRKEEYWQNGVYLGEVKPKTVLDGPKRP